MIEPVTFALPVGTEHDGGIDSGEASLAAAILRTLHPKVKFTQVDIYFSTEDDGTRWFMVSATPEEV